jgi:hypothetical protein
MSYFKYGSHTHTTNEVNLTRMDIRNVLSPRGLRMEKEIRLFLVGEIQDTGSALLTKIATLIDSAYQNDYGDAGLYLDDGTPTRHRLDNTGSLTGVRIIQRSWPKGDAAELATKRTFSLTLAAVYPDAESNLLAWWESLELIGNAGPRMEVVETTNGPKLFQTSPKSVQRIIQRGEAMGHTAYVLPPGPIFADIEHQDMRQHGLASGRQRGQAATHYKTTWLYRMTSETNRSGVPLTR